MTLGTFLDAAYTVLVDENVKASGSLLRALDANENWRSGGPSSDSPDPENLPPAGESAAGIERQNVDALAALQQLMAGTQFKGKF
jgi:hypothetical protein